MKKKILVILSYIILFFYSNVLSNEENKILKIARDLLEMNFNIIATSGTSDLFNQNGILSNNIFILIIPP